jgi:hypothetical protein
LRLGSSWRLGTKLTPSVSFKKTRLWWLPNYIVPIEVDIFSGGKIWNLCYDFRKNFRGKIRRKMAFWLKQKVILQKIDHNICFVEKIAIFLLKIGKNRRKL